MEPCWLFGGLPRVSLCSLLVISCLLIGAVSPNAAFLAKTSILWESRTLFQRRNTTNVSIWRHLACITTQVYTQQNLMDNMEDDRVDDLLIVLFDVSSTRPASYFMSEISAERPYLQFITSQMGSHSSSNRNISDIVAMFMSHSNKSQSVVIFSDSVNEIVAVLEAVSLSEQLRYTGLLHTTEWLLVLTVLVDDVLDVLFTWSRTVDFITLVYMPFINTTFIAQRSRTQNLTVKAKVIDYNVYPGQPIFEVVDRPGISCGILKSSKEILRKSAWLFLKSQKSVLEKMRLPVGVSRSVVTRNMTKIDSNSMELLGLLTMSLGFQHQLVSSTDQSIYGIVTGTANGTGISGLLARREVVLTTMPFTMNKNRVGAMHYIPVRTYDELAVIMYRWSRGHAKIDLIYIYIMNRSFIYMLLATLLSLAVIGAIVQVGTRSCSLQVTEPFSAADIRHMSSFPGHVCFKYSGPYVAHSGRILLASWAVLLVVLGSAYSAFLVTNFVTAEEPPIKSLQELNSKKDFKVGYRGTAELAIFILNTSTDATLSEFWKRLVADNRTDPDTFSTSTKTHMEKITAGGYAHVGSSCILLGQCEEFISENITDLLYIPVEDRKLYGQCFVAVAKNVFFADDLYKFLLRVDETGILQFLRRKYLNAKLFNDAFVPLKSTIYQSTRENTRVGFERILFVLYLGLTGIGVGVACLLMELFVYRVRVRDTVYG